MASGLVTVNAIVFPQARAACYAAMGQALRAVGGKRLGGLPIVEISRVGLSTRHYALLCVSMRTGVICLLEPPEQLESRSAAPRALETGVRAKTGLIWAAYPDPPEHEGKPRALGTAAGILESESNTPTILMRRASTPDSRNLVWSWGHTRPSGTKKPQ